MNGTDFKTGIIVVLAILLGCLMFVPGLFGPFFFDDYSNLLNNQFLRIEVLSLDALYRAAFSLSAGPLQRPIPMASFALDYYFAGSFDSAFRFKLVNLVIHFINGLLMFKFTHLILQRLRAIKSVSSSSLASYPLRWAGAVTVMWLVHPIQITSVLYVVQRMTEIATLFSLLGLICFLYGRQAVADGELKRGTGLILVCFAIWWPAALYSKEIALLLPVFALALEYTLFGSEKPWSRWHLLPRSVRYALISLAALASLSLLAASLRYSLPHYADRPFTLDERVLTEARVLFFYIGLILTPRVDQFGLFHDDITISTSPWTPWTTLPALFGLLALAWLAVRMRRTRPLVALGILWFFAGHLLESTVFPLEIAHEHRNYLPSLGVLLVAIGVVGQLEGRRLKTLGIFALAALTIGGGTITAVRANQWSSEAIMASYEAEHHPRSAASLVRYANLLLDQRRYEESMTLVRRAAKLAPHELSYLISLQMVVVSRGGTVNADDDREITHRLATGPISATTLSELAAVGNCVTTKCRALHPQLINWIKALLDNPRSKDMTFAYYLLGRAHVAAGRYNDAIVAYKTANELDPYYMHPLLDLAELYLQLGDIGAAEVMVNALRHANEQSLHRRDKEIGHLSDLIRQRKENRQRHVAPRPAS